MNQSYRGIAIKIVVPVLLGLGVVVWLFSREFNIDDFHSISWNLRAFLGVALAVIAMSGREFGLMWRFRALTDRHLSWKQAFRVTMLVEFTSAVTPGTAGGGAMSMVFMKREGISYARGTILTVTTLFLDELFFVAMVPLLFIFIPGNEIFGFAPGTVGAGIRTAFWIVYGLIGAVCVLLFWSIFITPGAIGRILIGITSHRPFRRWHTGAVELRNGMVETGADLRSRNLSWWIESVLATVITWVSRYLVVNALFWGFATMADQAVVFARQGVVWTLLSVSPTPGGSGVSEWLFTEYYGDMLSDASLVLVIAVFWRLISYYIYLAAGAFIIPSWLRGSLKHKSKNSPR